MTGSLSALPLILCLLIGLAIGLVLAFRLAALRYASDSAALSTEIVSLKAQIDAERRAAQSAIEQKRGELESRSSVNEIMAPVASTLSTLQASITAADRQQVAAKAQLDAQLQELQATVAHTTASLGRETRKLTTALGKSEVRGAWGEMQLRRLMETSGLVEGVHFDTQVSTSADGGALRPDMLVHIGQDRDLVIDSKVSLRAFLDADAAGTQEAHEAAMDAHVEEIRNHIKSLSSKAYWNQFESAPEFVIMFVPAEGLLVEALGRNPELLESAMAKNVIVATPAVLMAVLRTVAHIWRQESAARQAREIHALGVELHSRMSTMANHFKTLGARISGSVDAYNQALSSLESRVLVTARKFEDMDVHTAVITDLTPIEKHPRLASAPELAV